MPGPANASQPPKKSNVEEKRCSVSDEVKDSNTPVKSYLANQKERFQIKSFNAVAAWAWNVQADNCAICRNPLQEICAECQAKMGSGSSNPEDGEGCKLAWGKCNHAFHYHCIQKWLAKRSVCPLDNAPWEYQKIEE